LARVFVGRNVLNFKYATEIGPKIIVLDNAISNSKDFVSVALNDVKRTSHAKIHDINDPNNFIQKKYRSAQVFDMLSNNKGRIFKWALEKKLRVFGEEYAQKYKLLLSKMESVQIVQYKKNQDFYSLHTDASTMNPRIVSLVLYLNDVSLGGETYFNNFDLSVHPRAGRLLIFPSNSSYSHEAKTPISSDKYVAVTWFAPKY